MQVREFNSNSLPTFLSHKLSIGLEIVVDNIADKYIMENACNMSNVDPHGVEDPT